jgi:hypothetical protein
MTQSRGTVAFDSTSELARLVFSWEMKKESGDYETIRAMQNYPGVTERLNMLVRRLKDFKKAGFEVVLIAHESIDKVYARGSAMAKAAQGQNNEPTALKGRIDIPGQVAPEEVMRVADNIFRCRLINGEVKWVCKLEPIGPGAPEPWQVKDRFNAQKNIGEYLPNSYAEIVRILKEKKLYESYWNGPYIWIIYGAVGMKKTRSLESFPKPIRIFDFDNGTSVLRKEMQEHPADYNVTLYNSEDKEDYIRFMLDFETTLGDPDAIVKVKAKLGIK